LGYIHTAIRGDIQSFFLITSLACGIDWWYQRWALAKTAKHKEAELIYGFSGIPSDLSRPLAMLALMSSGAN
jgi:hypothetical protein